MIERLSVLLLGRVCEMPPLCCESNAIEVGRSRTRLDSSPVFVPPNRRGATRHGLSLMHIRANRKESHQSRPQLLGFLASTHPTQRGSLNNKTHSWMKLPIHYAISTFIRKIQNFLTYFVCLFRQSKQGDNLCQQQLLNSIKNILASQSC